MEEPTEWIVDFYARFDADARLLMKTEPLWRMCSNCPDGHCCKKETVPVMGPEWDRIVAYVKSSFTKNDKRRLETNVDRGGLPCPFLFRGRCAVYPVRPWSCRIFPYTISLSKTAITVQSGNFYQPYCPSLAAAFGGKIDRVVSCQPAIIDRSRDGKLARIQIRNLLSLWVIDITSYQDEYEDNMPKNEEGSLYGDDMHRWVGLIRAARDGRMINQDKFLSLLGLD